MNEQLQLDTRAITDEAIARVKAHADNAWQDDCMRAIRLIARYYDSFTTDDVWDLLKRSGSAHTHEPRAMGAIMRDAQRKGWIRATSQYRISERAVCHRRPLRVWERGEQINAS